MHCETVLFAATEQTSRSITEPTVVRPGSFPSRRTRRAQSRSEMIPPGNPDVVFRHDRKGFKDRGFRECGVDLPVPPFEENFTDRHVSSHRQGLRPGVLLHNLSPFFHTPLLLGLAPSVFVSPVCAAAAKRSALILEV